MNSSTILRVGSKLEAVDKKESQSICVASIAGTLDSRILVHFDSWDDRYDYWVDTSSPFIHPVGWCKQNGIPLTLPSGKSLKIYYYIIFHHLFIYIYIYKI